MKQSKFNTLFNFLMEEVSTFLEKDRKIVSTEIMKQVVMTMK